MARNTHNNIIDNYQKVARDNRKAEFNSYWLQNIPPELRNNNMRNGFWSALPMENYRGDDTFVMGGGGGNGVGP